MKKALLIIQISVLCIAYLLVLLVRTMLELVRRVMDTICQYFDEVLDGVEAPYMESRKRLSEKQDAN